MKNKCINSTKLDNDCRYKELCEEFYSDDENFKCTGSNNCEHYDAYLEGECAAIESEGIWK